MDKAKYNNGRRHEKSVKDRAVILRNEGKTHREISKSLGISLGSASSWTKNVVLTAAQKKAVFKRRTEIVYTKEVRERISKTRREYLAIHPYQKYSNEDLLNKIKTFHTENERIPLKREFNAWGIYQSRFGSWNDAVRLAGFETNPVLFAKKFIARDGHKCDSFTEKVIDNLLFKCNIPHARNVRYGSTKMTADFSLGKNTLIEFFGLAGVQKKYDQLIIRKRALSKRLNLKLIELYPDDIYPKNKLLEMLKGIS